jgi:hypothetical protein
MNEDITNYNNKGKFHGYQERYSYYDYEQYKLWARANFKNGNRIGYLEDHHIKQTNYHII